MGYFDMLFGNEWELVKSPAGAWQWTPKDIEEEDMAPDPEDPAQKVPIFMSTADMAMRYDPEYEQHGNDYPVGYVRWTEKRNMEEFLRLVQAGKVNAERLVTHEFTLDRAAEAYDTLVRQPADCLAVRCSLCASPIRCWAVCRAASA